MAVLLCCITALGTGAFAVTANQSVELNAKGSEAELVMDFPQAAAEQIASMQISFDISSSDGAAVEFIPDSGLNAKIVESRYHYDTGIFTVYLAGTKALFSDAPLKVGKIRINGSSVSARVDVKQGSIKFVRGSELVEPVGDVLYPASATITTGGSSVTPPWSSSTYPSSSDPSSSSASSDTSGTSTSSSISDTSTPTSTSDTSTSSSTSDTPSASSSSDMPTYPDTSTTVSTPDSSEFSDVPVVVPVEPADTSSLANAVERASGYKRADYTEESYAALLDALSKANAVLANTGSTQDEIDEALLILENAIGMLTANGGTSSSSSDSSSVSSDTPDGELLR